MRRLALTILGSLELVLAVVVASLAVRLPGRDAVEQAFERVRRVSTGAADQVDLLRGQVEEIREQDFGRVALQLRENARALAVTLQSTRVDFRAVESLASALGDVATGLESWAGTLAPERLRKLSEGLGAAAAYLEEHVTAPAARAADGIEASIAGLEKDARRLTELLQKSPSDTKALRAVYDGLGRFDAGLGALARVLKLERLGAVRDGFAGMEASLGSTAEQVDKLSAFTYPVVKLSGFRPPDVEMKPFWAEGPRVADGLRKAVTGVRATVSQLDRVNKDLPGLRDSLDESRSAVNRARTGLGTALKQQGEVDALIGSIPRESAALAETLPEVGRSFAKMLRQTRSLRDAANALRHVQQLIDDSAAHWPDLAAAMNRSAAVLRGARGQLQAALGQREQYERAIRGSSDLARLSAEMLPMLSNRLDARLGQQEYSLTQMGRGLREVNDGLPGVERAAAELLGGFGWVLWLTSVLLAFHGMVVIAGNRPRRPVIDTSD